MNIDPHYIASLITEDPDAFSDVSNEQVVALSTAL
jgi:hypothetical protein